jgi:hypothetical protein
VKRITVTTAVLGGVCERTYDATSFDVAANGSLWLHVGDNPVATIVAGCWVAVKIESEEPEKKWNG